MSVLSFPRINFRGIFRTNPCTSNNDDVLPYAVDRDADTLGADLAGMTDAQITAFLRQQVIMSNDPPSEQNQNPPCINFIRAGWNLYGDFATSFENAAVTSVIHGPSPSQRSTSPSQDPLVGGAVQLLGSPSQDPARRGSAMICDLDPTGLVTTQLWVGGLQIGDTIIDYDTRAFQNWLNFSSTVGPYTGEQNFVGIVCTWQFAIPARALPEPRAIASAGMRTLIAAALVQGGLAVRFRTFEIQPELRDEEMYARFQQGQAIANPALGYVVGTVGVWNASEPATEVAGRKLTVPYPRPAMAWRSPDGRTSGGIPGSPQAWGAPPALIGNTVAQVDASRSLISLDLVGTFPKFGFRDPDGPNTPTARGFAAPKQMANVGTVELAVVPVTGGAPQSLATLDYGLGAYSAYEDFGGIVDIPYEAQYADLIATGTLVLQATTAPNPGVCLLQEATVRVVTDDRTMYLMPGAANQPVRIKVYDRGGPTQADTVLYLFAYSNIIQPQFGGNCTTKAVRPNQTVAQAGAQTPPQAILSFPATVTIPAGAGFSDWFVIDITATGSGATILSYQLENTMYGTGTGGVAGVPVWSTATYSAIRIYPDENFSALYTDGTLAWDDVYEKALRYYALLFPAMSQYIPLNSPDFLTQQASLVQQRLSTPADATFWTTYNMPATRTMSPAKVKLVVDFVTQQQLAKGRQAT